MKIPFIIAISLVTTACHQLDTPLDTEKSSQDSVISKNMSGHNKCQRMPPILDKKKLIAMLVKEGEINPSDSEAIKLQKLERYVLNKRKGLSTKCKK